MGALRPPSPVSASILGPDDDDDEHLYDESSRHGFDDEVDDEDLDANL